jgi:hypothetical protein
MPFQDISSDEADRIGDVQRIDPIRPQPICGFRCGPGCIRAAVALGGQPGGVIGIDERRPGNMVRLLAAQRSHYPFLTRHLTPAFHHANLPFLDLHSHSNPKEILQDIQDKERDEEDKDFNLLSSSSWISSLISCSIFFVGRVKQLSRTSGT